MESASLYEKNASGESMTRRHENWKLYESRIEPKGLKKGKEYIDPRTSDDLSRMRALERELMNYKKDLKYPVLVPWISPPFGKIVGYGVYSQKEANKLADRAEKEFWGYPTIGEEYDLDWFSWKINDLTESNAKHQDKKRRRVR